MDPPPHLPTQCAPPQDLVNPCSWPCRVPSSSGCGTRARTCTVRRSFLQEDLFLVDRTDGLGVHARRIVLQRRRFFRSLGLRVSTLVRTPLIIVSAWAPASVTMSSASLAWETSCAEVARALVRTRRPRGLAGPRHARPSALTFHLPAVPSYWRGRYRRKTEWYPLAATFECALVNLVFFVQRRRRGVHQAVSKDLLGANRTILQQLDRHFDSGRLQPGLLLGKIGAAAKSHHGEGANEPRAAAEP
jgi:hypothetical protein